MYFWNKICGFITVFFLSALFSTAQETKYAPLAPVKKPIISAMLIVLPENKNFAAATSLNMISKNYYTQHLGFMCKKELALEKITKVPLRFRLGSLQQCNYLEGKK